MQFDVNTEEGGEEGPEIMRFRGKTRDKRQRHARNRVEKMEPRACESSFFLPLMGSGRARNIRFGIIERW